MCIDKSYPKTAGTMRKAFGSIYFASKEDQTLHLLLEVLNTELFSGDPCKNLNVTIIFSLRLCAWMGLTQSYKQHIVS